MSDREQLEQAIAQIEAQRTSLGNAATDAAIAGLRQQLVAVEQSERPTLEGERKVITVMFADISGFTAMSEKMDPETARNMVHVCFEQLVPIVTRYGGTVCKFLGDGIMVLFGAPLAHENDPERALRAALDMMDALAVFSARWAVDLGMHTGINTGIAAAKSNPVACASRWQDRQKHVASLSPGPPGEYNRMQVCNKSMS